MTKHQQATAIAAEVQSHDSTFKADVSQGRASRQLVVANEVQLLAVAQQHGAAIWRYGVMRDPFADRKCDSPKRVPLVASKHMTFTCRDVPETTRRATTTSPVSWKLAAGNDPVARASPSTIHSRRDRTRGNTLRSIDFGQPSSSIAFGDKSHRRRPSEQDRHDTTP